MITNDEAERPAPEATGNGPENCSQEQTNRGDVRKQLALDLFRMHRAELVAQGVKLLVEEAAEKGQATTDDVRARMVIPAGVNAKFLGAVPNILARRGLIRHCGYRKSRRPEAHSRELKVWELVRRPDRTELESLFKPRKRNNSDRSDPPLNDGPAAPIPAWPVDPPGGTDIAAIPERPEDDHVGQIDSGTGSLFPDLTPAGLE